MLIQLGERGSEGPDVSAPQFDAAAHPVADLPHSGGWVVQDIDGILDNALVRVGMVPREFQMNYSFVGEA